jgi:hypothetical protein
MLSNHQYYLFTNDQLTQIIFHSYNYEIMMIINQCLLLSSVSIVLVPHNKIK